MASYSTSSGSSSISARDRAPKPPRPPKPPISPSPNRRSRPPVLHRDPGRPADNTQSSMWKVDVDEEIRWRRSKYKACLKRYEHYLQMSSEDIVKKFLRNMAQQVIKSAFKHLNPVEERLRRMSWRIDVLIGSQQTKVKGYPAGQLLVLAEKKKFLVDWQEEEFAVLLASAIVDILMQSDAEKYLRARDHNDYKLISQIHEAKVGQSPLR